MVSAPGNTTESLLSIVTSQRERFKQRNIELESVSQIALLKRKQQNFYKCLVFIVLPQENQQQKQSINVLQREMDTLRGDNVKLYEKIRFLQTYQGNVSYCYPMLLVLLMLCG